MNQFNRLEQFAKLQRPPAVKFKDLEAAVNSTISYNMLPMKVRADFIRVTELQRADQHHAAVRQQGPAVPGQRRRLRRPSSTSTRASPP